MQQLLLLIPVARQIVFVHVSQPVVLTCSCTQVCTVQVGVVQAGQAFPFWARQQTKLLLKVTTAHPASLVQLVRDSEVAVAPRPRRTLAQQSLLKDTHLKSAPASLHQESGGPDTWLRLQVKLCLCYADSCMCWSTWSVLIFVLLQCIDTHSALHVNGSRHLNASATVQAQRSAYSQTSFSSCCPAHVHHGLREHDTSTCHQSS